METCSRCEKIRTTVHGSGLCRPCYVRMHAAEATCVSCGEVRAIQGHGLCRRCYLAQPHVREKKNKQRREAYAADPARRRELAGIKADAYRSKGGKEKQAARNRRHFYRLEPEQYQAMLLAQEGSCAVCALVFVEGAKRTTPHVDHCHTTGRARGLLCAACNAGIGHLGDNLERVESAAAYLRRATMVDEQSAT